MQNVADAMPSCYCALVRHFSLFLRQNFVKNIVVAITYSLLRYDYVFCGRFALRVKIRLQ